MNDARAQLEAAIAGLEAQRDVLGSALVDAALAPLRERLAALQDTPAPAQALRPVTVLFMDVVGFTALSRRLDPEDLHELIDGALARCTAVVAAHGGRVMQYAGDQLLAVFGERQAQEDDAERAVRTGLALLAEGRALGERARQLAGADATADVRVGIHTGPVLLGGGVDGDGAIRGLTVNVAARMEQTAPPGGLRISRDTWRQVRGLFDAEAQPPLDVKGLDAPLPTWIVRGELAAAEGAAQRGVDGLVTPLVGRDAERAALRAALDSAVAAGRLERSTLLADAGLGKSRLLAAVQADAAAHPARPQVHRARALRHGLHQPYGVLRHWLSAQGGLADSDDADTARAKLAALFDAAQGEAAGDSAALVGQLVGLDFSHHPQVRPLAHDARQLRQRAFHALAQWLLALAQQAPQVLLLDDMHWADEGSLDAVDHLAAACAGAPVLLAVFARPALRERRAAWCEGALELAPLAGGDAGTLLDALLQRVAAPPQALRELLLLNADGNPFHLEELVAMCLDDGVIVADASGPWRVDPARLSELRVPPTLAGVLQARLDALDATERRALQQASVIGHVHWDSTLRHLDEDAGPRLAALLHRELVVPHADSTFAGAQEFAFKHHLLHQATYDTVLKRERRDWHRRTAEWLVQASGGRVGEHLALVAEHWERAGDAAQAVAWWQRAADSASAAAAFAAAEHHLERALALLPQDDVATRFELLAHANRVFNGTGRRDRQRAGAQALLALAERSGDDRLRARAASTQAQVLLVTGDLAGAVAEADRALALAEALGDPGLKLFPLSDKAQALLFLGRLPQAEATLDAVLPLARAAGRRDVEAVVLSRLASVARELGQHAVWVSRIREGLAIAKAAHLRRMECGLESNLGVIALHSGRLDEAADHLARSLAIARAVGDRGSEAYTLSALSGLECERGDAAAAVRLARQGLACAEAAQDPYAAGGLMRQLGEYHALLGLADEARRWLKLEEENARQRGAVAPDPAAELIELALAEGRLELARGLADTQLAALDARPPSPRPDEAFPLRVLMACRGLALAEGDAPRAAALLARAHAHLQACAAALPDSEHPTWLRLRAPRAVAEAWAAAQQQV